MKLWPKNELLRKHLAHPIAGPFPPGGDAPADWPEDAFTTRRISDGDVFLEPPTRAELREVVAQEPVVQAGLTREQLEALTKSQLIEEAHRVGLDPPLSSSKADLVDMIAQAD